MLGCTYVLNRESPREVYADWKVVARQEEAGDTLLGPLPLHGGYYARSRCKNNPPRFGVSVEIARARSLSLGTASAGGRSQERVYAEDKLVYLSCSRRAVSSATPRETVAETRPAARWDRNYGGRGKESKKRGGRRRMGIIGNKLGTNPPRQVSSKPKKGAGRRCKRTKRVGQRHQGPV